MTRVKVERGGPVISALTADVLDYLTHQPGCRDPSSSPAPLHTLPHTSPHLYHPHTTSNARSVSQVESWVVSERMASAAPAPAATSPVTPGGPVNMDTPISLRVSVGPGQTKKFKLPLGDLNAQVLPGKVCQYCSVIGSMLGGRK